MNIIELMKIITQIAYQQYALVNNAIYPRFYNTTRDCFRPDLINERALQNLKTSLEDINLDLRFGTL